MEIVYSSNRGLSRQALLDYVRRRKSENPKFSVVDIGGASKPWTASIADTFVDLFPVPGSDVILGDVNEPEVWQEIAARGFDFCVCSHVLEDIRNPIFVMQQIQKLFRGGYIAIPNKHVEFSHVESSYYVGYGHHRWIFTLDDNELRVVAKFPFASFLTPRRRWIGQIKSSKAYHSLKRIFDPKRSPSIRELGYLAWWDKELAGRDNELALIWSGPLTFHVINRDFAGHGLNELVLLYRDGLAAGL